MAGASCHVAVAASLVTKHEAQQKSEHHKKAEKHEVSRRPRSRFAIVNRTNDGCDKCLATWRQWKARNASWMKLPGQKSARKLYNSMNVQVTIATIIILNFAVSVIEAQIRPLDDTTEQQVFSVTELIFLYIFTVELLLNMYAHWFVAFWRDPWCLFDVFVVATAWFTTHSEGLPEAQVLRTFRAFRVFRLFKRLESLMIVMVAIMKSLPGVMYAFIMLHMVVGCWAMIGVQYFADKFPDEFGSFGKAVLTMLQVCTFDSWVSGITRPVWEATDLSFFTALFFVTYSFISSIIMMNVVVAILLDKYIEAEKSITERRNAAIQIQRLWKASKLARSINRNISRRRKAKQEIAATVVQKFVRGWRQRRKMGQKKRKGDFHGARNSNGPRAERELPHDFESREEAKDEALQEIATRLQQMEERVQMWQREMAFVLDRPS